MRKVSFMTNDNVKVYGTLSRDGSNICVIMCHGIRAGKEEHGNFTKLAEELNKEKIDNFRFDFRGHGESKEDFLKMNIAGAIKDLETSIEYISKLKYKKIILLGASFGAGIISLIDYNKYENISNLILWYPCIVYENTDVFSKENVEEAINNSYFETKSMKTGKVFKFSKEFMIQTLKYKPSENLKENKLNKLFIHGDLDINTMYEDTRKCVNESINSKFITIKNGTHGFFDNKEHFERVMSETIKYIRKNK